MMNRALRLLSYEIRGLQNAVYVLALSSLVSSLLALLRDRLLAHAFGASTTLDLYYAAFRIPDLIFVGTGALVSVYILIPELARRSSREQKEYIDTVLAGFSFLAGAVSVVAAIIAPFILSTLFPQFVKTGELPTLVTLTRIMLLQPIFLGLSNILASLTQLKQRYALYSISPLLYNAGIILGVLILYPHMGIVGLAVGVIFGAFMHFAIQIPSVVADGFLHAIPRLRKPLDFLATVKTSVPRALALSMNQIAFLGLTALAAGLTSGSIAIFMFAYNLQAVPLSIIGASYSVAAFPVLARTLARNDHDGFIEHIASAARYIFFWSLPATALIIVLRAHMVRVVLGSGAFDWTDTRLTAAALALLCVSLAAQSLMLLLVRGYYAAGRTFMPFFISSVSAAATIALGALLLGVSKNQFAFGFANILLRNENAPGAEVLALAAAYSAVAILATLLLSLHFEHRFQGFFVRVWRSFVESLICAIGTGLAAYGMLVSIGQITFASTTASVVIHAFVAGFFGAVVGVLIYALMRNREYRETLETIRSRARGIIAPPTPSTVVVSAEEATTTSPQ